MIRPLALALALLFLGGCNAPDTTVAGGPSPTPTITPSPSAAPSPSPSSKPPFMPDPDVRVPRDPARLARGLEKVTRELRESIDDWRKNGNVLARPPKVVVWQALYQQRIYRLITRVKRLGDAVIPRLDKPLRPGATAIVTAGRRLRALVGAVHPDTEFRTQRPEPAGNLLRYYKKAERRFDVAWEVLAAVNYVETKFGRVKSPSSAGAQGPMQFLPSTWDAYGMGGDIHDPHDAIMGAANYLHASGAPQDYPKALYAYNPVSEYVDAITLYARRITADPRNYFAFYNWQVFVITTEGEQRLTGPGT